MAGPQTAPATPSGVVQAPVVSGAAPVPGPAKPQDLGTETRQSQATRFTPGNDIAAELERFHAESLVDMREAQERLARAEQAERTPPPGSLGPVDDALEVISANDRVRSTRSHHLRIHEMAGQMGTSLGDDLHVPRTETAARASDDAALIAGRMFKDLDSYRDGTIDGYDILFSGDKPDTVQHAYASGVLLSLNARATGTNFLTQGELATTLDREFGRDGVFDRARFTERLPQLTKEMYTYDTDVSSTLDREESLEWRGDIDLSAAETRVRRSGR